MAIKKVPIINIDINYAKKSFEKNKRQSPPVCPYCKKNIKKEVGYVIYEHTYEVIESGQYTGYDFYSFNFVDEDNRYPPSYKYYCPLCQHELTKAQAHAMFKEK